MSDCQPSHAARWVVRAPALGDRQRWGELFRGYADFYGVAQTEADAERVWSWIHDSDHEVNGLLAEAANGGIVGLAHYRPFSRPLTAATGCFLDDLFVDPTERGRGVADALLAELRRLAVVNGWGVVRWLTADSNYRARGKYDQYGTRTMWITYDMSP